MRIRSSHGVLLELHDLGGEGPSLLLVHATGFCAGAYRPLAAALGAGFHVWALDVRGHGDSDAPADGSMSWDAISNDVLAAVSALPDGPLVAVGHSMGGAAILDAERKVPGTFRGAFVYEPIVFPAGAPISDPSQNPLAVGAARRRPTFPSRAEALLRYASRPPLGELRADALAAYVEHGFRDLPDGTVTLKCPPEREAATFAAAGRVTTQELAGVALPTVVAAGQGGGPGPDPASFAPAVATMLKRGELRLYPHLGHFGPLQDPPTVAEEILGVDWDAL